MYLLGVWLNEDNCVVFLRVHVACVKKCVSQVAEMAQGLTS